MEKLRDESGHLIDANAPAGEVCPTCKGKGVAIMVGGGFMRPDRCPDCSGTGRLPAPAGGQPSLHAAMIDYLERLLAGNALKHRMEPYKDGEKPRDPLWIEAKTLLARLRAAGGEGAGERDDYDDLFEPRLAAAMRARDTALRENPNDQISALSLAIRAALAAGERAPEGTMPAYGHVSLDQLGRDVNEATTGQPNTFDFGDSFPGHVMTGINFNSLNRIVSKYLASAPAAPSAPPDAAVVERCIAVVCAIPYVLRGNGAVIDALRSLLPPEKKEGADDVLHGSLAALRSCSGGD